MSPVRPFLVAALAALLLAPSTGSAALLKASSYSSVQEALNAMRDGDILDLDATDKSTVYLNKSLKNVQIFGKKSLTLHLKADLEGAVFWVNVTLSQDPGTRFRKSIVFASAGDVEMSHVDSVAFILGAGNNHTKVNVGQQAKPRMQFKGFVRALTIYKLVIEYPARGKDPETSWTEHFAPIVIIDATDPVGNGWGSYLISPIVWQQRASTPFHIINGRGITIAHINTELNRYADPLVTIDNGIDCMLLCNGTGAAGQIGDHSTFLRTPERINYGDHYEFGHAVDNIPFRGAAYCIAGQRNKVAAQGDYKTWAIGAKTQLPALHYGDGIVARDPMFQVWPGKKRPGNLTWNFGLTASNTMTTSGCGTTFILNQQAPLYFATSFFLNPALFPVNGSDVIRPYIPRFPAVSGIAAGPVASAAEIATITTRLENKETVFLGAGTYNFTATLTKGKLIGISPAHTILQFPAGVICSQGGGGFNGFQNLTVRGGTWGYVNGGASIGREFANVVFEGQSEGGILINGNSQNDIIYGATFKNTPYGIKMGDHGCCGGWTGDPSIDKLDIAACHFINITKRAVQLVIDNGHSPNGQVAIEGCLFDDIEEEAIYINNGQTNLVQDCVFKNAGHGTAVTLMLKTLGATAVSHVDIDNTEHGANGKGIIFQGGGVISHVTVKGPTTSIDAAGSDFIEIDNTTTDGPALLPNQVGVSVVNSKLGSFDAVGTFKYLSDTANGTWVDTKTQFGTSKTGLPKLDTTPPIQDASGVEVKVMSDHHLVIWKNEALDPETGIVGYVVYVGGQEIGRTPYRINTEESEPGRPSAVMSTPYYRDYDKHSTNPADYVIRGFNGANMFADGTQAPLRKWQPLRGSFYYRGTDPAEECFIEDLLFVSEYDVRVTDAKGETFSAVDKLRRGIYPSIVYTTAGEDSRLVGIRSPRDRADRRLARPMINPAELSITSPKRGAARLELLTLRGRRVAVLVDRVVPQGSFPYQLPAGLAPGTYLLRLNTPYGMAHARQWVVK